MVLLNSFGGEAVTGIKPAGIAIGSPGSNDLGFQQAVENAVEAFVASAS